MASGWNLWVWLVDVVSRRQVWLVGGIYGCGYRAWLAGGGCGWWVESMGMVTMYRCG